jgi:hypothetical protein
LKSQATVNPASFMPSPATPPMSVEKSSINPPFKFYIDFPFSGRAAWRLYQTKPGYIYALFVYKLHVL